MWYGYSWWVWWWLAFVIIFFLLPLGYGWGYRGWGPPYRRKGRPPAGRPPGSVGNEIDHSSDWGATAILLWVVLFIAIVWLLAAFAWWT
ncbi:MAG: hypothetical protein IT176_15415 [Acidobacteria bacterium]|nr:hypothetical protein [Acidobacteriota bacterium]